MNLSPSEILSVVVVLVGVVIWLVRLEGRVNLSDRLLNDLTTDVHNLAMDAKYIRGRVDVLVGRVRRTDIDEIDEFGRDRRGGG